MVKKDFDLNKEVKIFFVGILKKLSRKKNVFTLFLLGIKKVYTFGIKKSYNIWLIDKKTI